MPIAPVFPNFQEPRDSGGFITKIHDLGTLCLETTQGVGKILGHTRGTEKEQMEDRNRNP